jgi:hypothetical protein
MAQSTTNVIVGAANVAIGSYSSDYNGTGDTLWNQLKQTVTSKNYRSWVVGLPAAGTAISIVGAIQTPTGAGSCTFKDVGLTQEGVEVQYQPDFGEVEVDQLLDAAKLFKQRMTVSVATTFAEATVDNLMTTWAQASGTQYTDVGQSTTQGAVRLSGGELGEAPNTATSYRQRVYLATRALSVEASTHALRRSEATVFPVTFRLLPDTAASYSAYGRVVDIS